MTPAQVEQVNALTLQASNVGVDDEPLAPAVRAHLAELARRIRDVHDPGKTRALRYFAPNWRYRW